MTTQNQLRFSLSNLRFGRPRARRRSRVSLTAVASRLVAIALVFVAVGCRDAVPPRRAAVVPPTPSASPVAEPTPSSTTPAPVVAPKVVTHPSTPPKPEGAIDARPSCQTYCELLARYCAVNPRAFTTLDRCLADCRHASWGPGRSGDRQQDTLGCRVAWAQAAAQDDRHCDDAGILSPACGADGVLPIVSLPRFEGGTCVLGLWDSTDAPTWKGGDRARDVILGERVRKVVESRGLTLSLHDVAGGLPPEAALRSCQAVVTSFYDAEMTDAARYAAWLRAVIQSGRRVVILNDYGAFYDKSTASWLENPVVNAPFMALGVEYGAEWTGNGKVLAISAIDKKSFVTRPDPLAAAHYFRFRPVSTDVNVLLELARKDVADGKSAVVFTSAKGGMAMSRYFETQDGAPLVDLSAFLARALGR